MSRQRPRPDVWSPLEYACHVRDVFRLFDQRLGLMLAEDDPQFANWDQDDTAVDDRYGEQDPAVVAGELAACRRGHRRLVRRGRWATSGSGGAGAATAPSSRSARSASTSSTTRSTTCTTCRGPPRSVAPVREQIHDAVQRAVTPDERALEKIRGQGKLTARERIDLLVDEGSFVEDGVLANAMATGLPADGVVTGRGSIDGVPAIVVANDPMVKAGSWGARTVEKMVRASEAALAEQVPIVWLVDSAGARLTDQVQLFPGRRGAGHIFYNQVKLSGQVPQVCCLFGPSAAGGAYIPSFCDVVFMVDGNASMYLGSPRMAEMVVGEITTLEEMGGARMHVSQSGCADNLAADDHDAIDQAKAYLSYFPRTWRDAPPVYEAEPPERRADPRHRAGRRAGAVRHARRHRRHRRPAQLLRDQAAVRPRADRRSGPPRRPPDRRRRQQLGAPRRHAVRRLGGQGGAVHLVLRRVQHPARLPRRRARVHDRLGGREAGDHPPRGEDGDGGQRGDGAQGVGDRAQGLRRRAVRDVRPGVRARCDDRPADGAHRRDGPGGGDQRRVRQQDRRHRGSRRARRVRRRAAGDLRDRRRPAAAGLGAGDRRRHRAPAPPGRADPPHRPRPQQGPPLRHTAATASPRSDAPSEYSGAIRVLDGADAAPDTRTSHSDDPDP